MFELFDPFKVSTWRRYLRIWLFIAKWLMLLLSASIELCLRRNFGRRYLPRLILAVVFYTFCAGVAPSPNSLTGLFLAGLFAALACHIFQILKRQWRSLPEPYTFSAGDSWLLGQFLKCPQTTVQRFVEPGLCFLLSLPLATVDPFLHLWLAASALALFVKEQIQSIKLTRQILDALDAKHKAQALNTALKAHQQPHGQVGQRAHRAHLPQPPRPGGHRRP
jgi:hypothetical protein